MSGLAEPRFEADSRHEFRIFFFGVAALPDLDLVRQPEFTADDPRDDFRRLRKLEKLSVFRRKNKQAPPPAPKAEDADTDKE